LRISSARHLPAWVQFYQGNGMAFRKNKLALNFTLGWIGWASIALGAAQLDSVTIGFSSFSGFYGPTVVARG
jgi:hypothetical protein